MQKRILVVESDEANAKALSEALRGVGLEPVIAQDGRTASVAMVSGRFAAALLAVKLPDIECREMVAELRRTPGGALLPVLLTGTSVVPSAIKNPTEALSVGADYYFHLPDDLPVVGNRVQGWIGDSVEDAAEPTARSRTHAFTSEPNAFVAEDVTEANVPTLSALRHAHELKRQARREGSQSRRRRRPVAESNVGAPRGDTALEMVRDGENLRSQGRVDAAIDAYVAAAELYEKAEKLDPALALYKLILHLDPLRMDIAERAGDSAVNAGRIADGLAIYRRAADSLERAGNLEDAVGMLDRLVALNPTDADLVLRQASLQAELEQDKASQAEVDVQDAWDDLLGVALADNHVQLTPPPTVAQAPRELSATPIAIAEALVSPADDQGGKFQNESPVDIGPTVDIGPAVEIAPAVEFAPATESEAEAAPAMESGAEAALAGLESLLKDGTDIIDAASLVGEPTQSPGTDFGRAEALEQIDPAADFSSLEGLVTLQTPVAPWLPPPVDTQSSALINSGEPPASELSEDLVIEETAKAFDPETTLPADPISDPAGEATDRGPKIDEPVAAQPANLDSHPAEPEPEPEALADELSGSADGLQNGPVEDAPVHAESQPEVDPPEPAPEPNEEAAVEAVEVSEADAVPTPPQPQADLPALPAAPEPQSETEADDLELEDSLPDIDIDIEVTPPASSEFSAAMQGPGPLAHLFQEAHAAQAHDRHLHSGTLPIEAADVLAEHDDAPLSADDLPQVFATAAPRASSISEFAAADPTEVDQSTVNAPADPGLWSELPVSPRPASVSFEAPSLQPELRTKALTPSQGRINAVADSLALLGRALQQGATGVLHLQESANLVLAEGVPSARRGKTAVQAFIRLLRETGQDLAHAGVELLLHVDSDRPVVVASELAARGKMDPVECGIYLNRHLEDGLAVLLDHRGGWWFEAGDDIALANDELVPRALSLDEILSDLLSTRSPWNLIEGGLNGHRSFKQLTPPAEDLSVRDQRLWKLLSSQHPLGDAGQLAGHSPERAAAFAATQVFLGRLEALPPPVQRPLERRPWLPLIGGQTPGERYVPAAVPPATRRVRAMGAHMPHQALADLDGSGRIRALAELVRTSDYFTILGLDTQATKVEIDRAHLQLRSMIQIPREAGDANLMRLANEVIRSLDEARDVLKVPELKAAYLSHLRG